jgi:hypothetical protein
MVAKAVTYVLEGRSPAEYLVQGTVSFLQVHEPGDLRVMHGKILSRGAAELIPLGAVDASFPRWATVGVDLVDHTPGVVDAALEHARIERHSTLSGRLGKVIEYVAIAVMILRLVGPTEAQPAVVFLVSIHPRRRHLVGRVGQRNPVVGTIRRRNSPLPVVGSTAERRHYERVQMAGIVQQIEGMLDTFVVERLRSDLDTDPRFCRPLRVGHTGLRIAAMVVPLKLPVSIEQSNEFQMIGAGIIAHSTRKLELT